MLNPSMFSKTPIPVKKIEIQKLSGMQRTRWDEPIQVPQILYQKFKVPPPKTPSTEPQVTNNIPPSLIDFVNRAYQRCKEGQRKLMQTELKEIIQKNKPNLHAINWDTFPIPNIGPVTMPHQETARPIPVQSQQPYPGMYGSFGYGPGGSSFMSNSANRTVQKETMFVPSNMYNQSLIDKIQKPEYQNKTQEILAKKLQMLKQKYQQPQPIQPVNVQNQFSQSNSSQSSSQPQKTFIGFKDEAQVRMEMLRQKYQQISQKNKLAQQPQPPLPQQTQQKPTTIQPPKQPPATTPPKPLKVIQSTVPQKVYQVKPLPSSLTKKPQPKPTAKITQKQLQSIVQAGKQQDLKTVAKRFTEFNKKIKPVKHIMNEQQQVVDEFDTDYKIVGKSKNIDKPYLRITHRPDPQTVRPEPVLRKSFNHYKSLYNASTPYEQIISQFRSIRQDLTVQDIRNSFTVEVYEENLVISLFQEDDIQFKQCLTNLWELYREGLYNKKKDRVKFISYYFVCLILQERYKELEYKLTLIPAQVLQQKQVQESLKLKRFLVIGNYHAFFTFYNAQDNVCQKIMNHYIDKIRVKFLLMASKTFGQKMPFKLLGENCGQDDDVLEALAKEEGAIISDGIMNLKESYDILKKSEYLQVRKVTSLLD